MAFPRDRLFRVKEFLQISHVSGGSHGQATPAPNVHSTGQLFRHSSWLAVVNNTCRVGTMSGESQRPLTASPVAATQGLNKVHFQKVVCVIFYHSLTEETCAVGCFASAICVGSPAVVRVVR
jgi:hypothetical protein